MTKLIKLIPVVGLFYAMFIQNANDYMTEPDLMVIWQRLSAAAAIGICIFYFLT